MAFRVLVCGGRDFDDHDFLWRVLDEIHYGMNITMLIHGAARGADSIASSWADNRHVKQVGMPAEWRIYGRGAGVVRNAKMLKILKPNLVIAFFGGRGTANMVKIARAAGVEVREPRRESYA